MKTVFLLAMLCCIHAVALANPNGITGRSTTGCGGAGCHGGAANGATSVTLNGPLAVDAGSTTDFTFIVGHATLQAAGYNLSIAKSGGGGGGTFEALDGSQVQGGELTHLARKDMVGGSASFPFRWTAPATHGTYDIRAAGNAVNGNGLNTGDIWNTFSATLTVRGATINAPAAGQTICAGQSVTMTWTQTGATTFSVEYSADGNNWTALGTVGANANTYTWNIPTNQAAGNAYRLRLVDVARTVSVGMSNTFAISAGPVITLQPLSQNVCVGRAFSLTASATGATAYRWRKNGTDIPGGTNAQFNVNVSTAADAGSYDCVIFGCNLSSTTTAAVITIDSKPAITAQPAPRTVCENDTVSFSVSAAGTAITYQWFKNDVVLIDKTDRVLKITLASAADEGLYKCEVRGTCDPAVMSTAVKLTVNIAPKVTTQPKTQSLKVGDELTLSVAADGTNLAYVWKKGGAPIPGATSATYKVTKVAKTDAGPYTCTVTNACGTDNSAVANVTVADASGPGAVAFALDTLSFGNVFTCTDTTKSATITNSGGSPITVATLTTADPELTISGITLPATIPAGGSSSFTVQYKPRAQGPFNGKVIATASAGGSADTLAVTANVAVPFTVNKDTLHFAAATADNQCLTIAQNAPCAFMITAIEVMGDQIITPTTPTLPAAVAKGGAMDVCFTTNTANGGAGSVKITTDAGVITRPFKQAGSTTSVDVVSERSIVIAPNPASDVVQISMDGAAVQRVSVMDATGALVFTTMMEGGKAVWNSVGLASGIYVVRVDSESTSITRTISIVR